VASILTPDKQYNKKHALNFPICSECFNEVSFELSQIEKANQNKKLRKLESTYIDVFKGNSPPLPSNTKGRPKKQSPGLPFVGRKALKHFGSFQGSRIDSLYDSLNLVPDNKMYDAAIQHNLHHIPAIEELAKELGKLKLSDSLMVGIVESVVSSY
jgi:hypothetical protein